MFKLKRAYEKPLPKDGFRVLIERLWPRGVSKKQAALDLWLKDIAPSTGLRKWFSHDPVKWKIFQSRYAKELRGQTDLIRQLRQRAEKATVTLVYGSRDEKHNAAVALKKHLERKK